jgi:hypothetical protein
MLPSSHVEATIRIERRLVDGACSDLAGPIPAVPTPPVRDRIGAGAVGSLVLHVTAVLLAILALPSLLRAPPAEIVVPIDLVQLGDRTASPPAPDKAALPQEKARETATAEPADPVPLAENPPPPEATARDAEEEPTAEKQAVIVPEAKPAPPKAKARPKSDHPAVAAPLPKAPPVDDLDARLKSLARQQQLQANAPPNPRRQDGAGESDVTAMSDTAATGRRASYDAKDSIRVQIERHWRPDVGALGAGDVVVAIHLRLNRDGSVGSAEIVEDPRIRASAAYRSLALSARNAALLSSPLALPPGRYDEVRDLTLNFNPKNALR